MAISQDIPASSGFLISNKGTCGLARDIEVTNQAIRSIGMAISFLSCLTTAFGAFADEQKKMRSFHAEKEVFQQAVSSSERALDDIIRIQESDDEIILFARKTPRRNKDKDAKFSSLFSRDLLLAWAKAERQAVSLNCGGKYIAGDDCGIGINPITCAQDYSDEGYVYRTESSSQDAAVISYRWPHFPEVIATYRMIQKKGRWILDGVSCRQGPTFNMKSDFHAK